MANALYDFGRQNILEGDILVASQDIRCTSIDEDDDTPVLATDEDLADIIVGAREFTSGAFAGKTTVAGTFDATDLAPAFTGATGDEFESFTIYFHSGVDATALLICNIDTATGLPLTPDGGNINITWSAAADRIFTL